MLIHNFPPDVVRAKRPKVIFVGFNKTATTSLHRLFTDSGYTGYHHNRDGESLGLAMSQNLRAQRPLLSSFSDVDVYIDFTYLTKDLYIEGVQYFRMLYKEYPDAYYILQTRNQNDWLRSRLNHAGFLERACRVLKLSEAGVTRYWRDLREAHFADVLGYFNSHERFFVFDIDKTPIENLIRFLEPCYELDKSAWAIHNKTAV